MAEAHNYSAIVVTVDSPHTGIRDRERRVFFHLPEGMQHPHTPAHIPLPELQEGDQPCISRAHENCADLARHCLVGSTDPPPRCIKGCTQSNGCQTCNPTMVYKD